MNKTFLFLLSIFVTGTLAAQQLPGANGQKNPDDLGWTSSMDFDGNIDSNQRVFDINSTVGYNFTKHWGADLGVPFEFVSSSTSTSTSSSLGNGSTSTSPTSSSTLNSVGNVFMDLRFKAASDVLNYSSSLTTTAPTGSESKGVSTGRATLGWDNRIEHEFGPITPFLEAGLGNSVTDSRLYRRPFTTLGFVSQFSAGTSVDLGHDLSVGASLFDVLPEGQQKLFSKIVGKGAAARGNGNHGRAYEVASESVGTSTLTRDNGDSAWVEYSPGILDFQVGYTHSVHYALNTFAFSAGVDVGKLLRKSASN